MDSYVAIISLLATYNVRNAAERNEQGLEAWCKLIDIVSIILLLLSIYIYCV